MPGLLYRHPILYDATLRVIHGTALLRRMEILADEIGEGVRVFDVGCGTCTLQRHLKAGCRYMGLDLNERFVRHAQGRGIAARVGDVFDEGNYPGDLDVIVLSDILHHIIPRHDELVALCKRKAGKVIVCEPHSQHPPSRAATSGLVHRGWRRLCSIEKFNRVFGDFDGHNRFDEMKLWDEYVKEKLTDLLTGYGMRTRQVDDYVIGVWQRR